MIIHNSKSVNKNRGSSALLRAYGWGGQAQFLSFLLSFFSAPPPKIFRAPHNSNAVCGINSAKQAGKKKRGPGGNEFLPAWSVPKSGTGGGKRLILASARKQSQKKLFPFRRIYCARPLKNVSIFFWLCLLRLWRSEPLGGICARQGAKFCSKKVRAAFSKCDKRSAR